MEDKMTKNKFFDAVDTVSFAIVFLFSLVFFLKQENNPVSISVIGFICIGLGFIGAGVIAYITQPFFAPKNRNRNYYLLRTGVGFLIVLVFGIIYAIAKWLS